MADAGDLRPVGGGDSFVSGLAYELLNDLDVDTALAFGIAHGAPATTTPGDTSMAMLAEGTPSRPAGPLA